MLLKEKTSDPNPKIVAATVHARVSAIRDPKLRFIQRIILLGLLQRREYGLRREPVLERHDASFYSPREGVLRGAEPLRGGDEHPVALLPGLPEQRYTLDEVALGPETEDLQLDYLPCVRVSQCKVWDERRSPLGEGQHIASPFELPAACFLGALPGPEERPADIVGLALVFGPQIVTLQSGCLWIQLQNSVPALPLYICREI